MVKGWLYFFKEIELAWRESIINSHPLVYLDPNSLVAGMLLTAPLAPAPSVWASKFSARGWSATGLR